MISRSNRALIAVGFLACVFALFIKSALADQSSWLAGLGTLVLILVVLVEAERNRHIGPRAQQFVLAGAAGVVVSEPILWILDTFGTSALGVEFTGTSDPITLIAGAAAVAYSWRYRRKRDAGRSAGES